MALENDCSYVWINFLLGLQRDVNITLLSLFPVSLPLSPPCLLGGEYPPTCSLSMMLCLILSQKHQLQL